ncbi:hypothetical protein PV783_13585 [Chitinophaga sp. CC14]|uniref:hypothetical protein n=1 Tax=Chitinophaga sp. CC14 TaxID=3029199 RepID=UPI003B8123CA
MEFYLLTPNAYICKLCKYFMEPTNLRNFLLTLSFFCSLSYAGTAQTESLYLQFDKTICYPSDTCWFRAYLFKNSLPGNVSNNLYVELFDSCGHQVKMKRIPVVNGMTIGQIELPKTAGLYWLRAHTKTSPLFYRSITIRAIDGLVVTRNLYHQNTIPALSSAPGLLFNTIFTSKGISCTIYPEKESKYLGESLRLKLNYYGAQIGNYDFKISNRQRNILISSDSLKGYVHGYINLDFYHRDTLVISQQVYIPCREIAVELTRDTGFYTFHILDSSNWNFAIAVVRGPRQANQSINDCLSPYLTNGYPDSNWLNYSGRVINTTKKRDIVKDQELVVMIEKDSATKTTLVPIGHLGEITFSGMYFYDTAYLNYMLNGYPGDRLSDIKLEITQESTPQFHPPQPEDYSLDTLYIPATFQLPKLDSLKYLKPVIVSASYKKALDERYTTGRFSWPAHFKFDLIHIDKFNMTIMDYLNVELPWFMLLPTPNSVPSFKGKSVTFYLDEQVVNWRELTFLRISDLAYVKVIEDFPDDSPYTRSISEIGSDAVPTLKNPGGRDSAPAAMICIYTRKGKDLRTISGNLQKLPIRGYDKPLTWQYPDRTTLLWAPFITASEYKFPVPGPQGQVTLIAEGVNKYGETFHFERVLQ